MRAEVLSPLSFNVFPAVRATAFPVSLGECLSLSPHSSLPLFIYVVYTYIKACGFRTPRLTRASSRRGTECAAQAMVCVFIRVSVNPSTFVYAFTYVYEFTYKRQPRVSAIKSQNCFTKRMRLTYVYARIVIVHHPLPHRTGCINVPAALRP